MPRHLRHQAGDDGALDIGRVGEDEVEAAGDGGGPVGDGEGGPAGKTKPRRIVPRQRRRRRRRGRGRGRWRRETRTAPPAAGSRCRCRGRAPGAPRRGRGRPRAPPRPGFRIRAGDQRGGGDGEGQRPEFLGAQQVGDRGVVQPAAQQVAEAGGGGGGTAARGSRSRSSCRHAMACASSSRASSRGVSMAAARRCWPARQRKKPTVPAGSAQVLPARSRSASRRSAIGAHPATPNSRSAPSGALRSGRVAPRSAASRAASSSAVSASTISSNSPSMTRSILCRVRPIRWSVTRPWGKL